MVHEPWEPDAVVQNLKDAGCADAFIEKFLLALKKGPPGEPLRLLACQRCRLLEGVHAEQKKLDCLDYLRCQLKKRAAAKQGGYIE